MVASSDQLVTPAMVEDEEGEEQDGDPVGEVVAVTGVIVVLQCMDGEGMTFTRWIRPDDVPAVLAAGMLRFATIANDEDLA